MSKILTRIALIVYPVVALCLYLFLLRPPYDRLAVLELQYEVILASQAGQRARLQAEQQRDEQRKQIGRLLSVFMKKVEDFDKATVPLYIADMARSAGVRFVNFTVKGESDLEGFRFVDLRITVRGGFNEMVSFLRELEEHKRRFVQIQDFKIKPGKAEEGHAVDATVTVLLSAGRRAMTVKTAKGGDSG